MSKSSTPPGSLETEDRSSAKRGRPKRNKQADRKISLDANEMYDAIPVDGIHIRDLEAKFSKTEIRNNPELFDALLKAASSREAHGMFKRCDQLPTMEALTTMTKKAKEFDTAMRKAKREDIKVDSELTGSPKITVLRTSTSDIHRVKSRPKGFCRMQYEYSHTLSPYVDEHTHGTHPQISDLRLEDDCGFQSYGNFNPRKDITRKRIDRHLIWAAKKNPSSFVSVFDNPGHALNRANFKHDKSQLKGRRIFVASISTQGLYPAVITGRLEETITIKTVDKDTKERTRIIFNKSRDVRIPAWVRSNEYLCDGRDLTFSEVVNSGTEIWLSILDLRHSDLKVDRARKGHPDEWLACGAIPKKYVTKVQPFDGYELHAEEDRIPVASLKSNLPWVYDWKKQLWILDKDIWNRAWFLRTIHRTMATKKQMVDTDTEEDESSEIIMTEKQLAAKKRAKNAKLKETKKRKRGDTLDKTKVKRSRTDNVYQDFSPHKELSYPGGSALAIFKTRRQVEKHASPWLDLSLPPQDEDD